MNRMQLYQLLVENGNDRAEARSIVESVAEEDLKNLNSDLVDLDEILDALGIEVEEEEDDDEDADDEDEEEDLTPDPRSARQAELSARAHAGAQPARESAVKEQGSDAQLNPLSKAWGSFAKALPPQVKNVDRKVVVGSAIAMVVLLFSGCIALSSFVLAIWPTNENMATPVAVFETPSSQDGGFLIPFETPEQGVINDAFGIGGEPVAQAPETIVAPTETPTPVPVDWWKTSDEEVASVFDLADILRKPLTIEGWVSNPNLGLLGFLIVLPLAILAKVGHDAEKRKESDARIALGMIAVMVVMMVVAEAVTVGGQLSGGDPGETAVWLVRLGVVVSITGAVVAAILGQTDLTAATAVVFIDGLLIFGWYGSAGPMWLLAGYGLMLLGACGELIELYLENRLKSGIVVGSIIGLAFYLFMVVAVIIGSALTTMAPWPSVLVYVQAVMIYLAVKGGPLAAIIFAMIVIYAFGDAIAGLLIQATAPGQRKGVATRREASTLAPNETTAVYDAQILGIMLIAMTLAPLGTFLATIMVSAQ